MKLELKKLKSRVSSRKICAILIVPGVLSFALSVIYNSQVLAFIGLGLIFWGALFLFLKPDRHVKSILLDSTVTPALETLSKIVAELGYKGRAVYLPPKYLTTPKSGLVYITKKEDEESASRRDFRRKGRSV